VLVGVQHTHQVGVDGVHRDGVLDGEVVHVEQHAQIGAAHLDLAVHRHDRVDDGLLVQHHREHGAGVDLHPEREQRVLGRGGLGRVLV